MNQITTSVYQTFERGIGTYVTEYSADCGCRWVVDMYGNVRTVNVCSMCMKKPDLWEDQLSLLPVDGESRPSVHTQTSRDNLSSP